MAASSPAQIYAIAAVHSEPIGRLRDAHRVDLELAVSVNHKVLARARAGRQAPERGRFRNRRRAAAWVGSALLLGLADDGWGAGQEPINGLEHNIRRQLEVWLGRGRMLFLSLGRGDPSLIGRGTAPPLP